MYRRILTAAMLAASFVLPAAASPSIEEFHATFAGFNETPLAILSEGAAHLTLKLDRAAQTVWFELTYSGLSAPVTQSHIHFGKVHVTGSVMVFFCSNVGGPAGVQACPANGGTVTGTITAANILGIATQHVTAGDFDALTDALASNTAYANIHSTNFPGGEIRGQIHRGADDAD